MFARSNQVLLHWRDRAGAEVVTAWSLASQADSVPGPILTLATAAQACSDLQLMTVQWQTSHQITPPSLGDGDYSTSNDRLHLTGRLDGNAGWPRYQIPGPKETTLMVGGLTAAIASEPLLTLIGAMTPVLGTAPGSPLVEVVRGRLLWAGVR